MKNKRLALYNNSILFAEHLNRIVDLLEDGYSNLNFIGNRFGFGILDYSLDQIAISDGILCFQNISGVFKDGTIFSYDRAMDTYDLSLDLKLFSEDLFITPKMFYLTKDSQNIIEPKEIVTKSEEIINVEYEYIKLRLTDQNNSDNLSIAKVSLQGGAFTFEDFLPPSLSVKKNSPLGSEINKLLFILRKNIMNLKEQLVINSDFNTQIILSDLKYCAVLLNMIYTNEFHPFEIYKVLSDAIGKISWKIPSIPSLPIYEHNNSFSINMKLIKFITEIISSSKSNYEKIEFSREENLFFAPIEHNNIEDILLIIEPNNPEIQNWILNTVISSAPFYENNLLNRLPGISREILEENSSEIIVKLDKNSVFFSKGSNLNIFINNVAVTSLSFYYKKSA